MEFDWKIISRVGSYTWVYFLIQQIFTDYDRDHARKYQGYIDKKNIHVLTLMKHICSGGEKSIK